ncbi:MPME1 protein [Mycobacterium phage Latretium]|nr:MPME1 protein [Mycobacterium phage Latretium]
MKASTQGTDIPHLSSEHRDRAWRDRFNARWHHDYGGWIRTRPQDEASTFALIPTKHYGPFTEDHSCPACLVVHPPEDCPVLSGNTDMLVVFDYDTSPNKAQADTADDDPR